MVEVICGKINFTISRNSGKSDACLIGGAD